MDILVPKNKNGRVAGGGGEDVGAGDRALALLLQLRLDVVDQVEPAQRLARVRVPLAPRRVHQHRRVRALINFTSRVELIIMLSRNTQCARLI
jgi:hypothetical protein